MKKNLKNTSILLTTAVLLFGAASMVSAAPKNGWVQENGSSNGWYYYVNGEKQVNNWALAGNTWYYLGNTGEMVTNRFINNSSRYDANVPDDSGDEWYYVDRTGAMQTGWLERARVPEHPGDDTEAYWYYFGADGKMYTSAWVLGAASWYYVLEDGTMLEDVIGPEIEDDSKYRNEQDNIFDYAYNKSGALLTGWVQNKDTKDWYFAGPDSVLYRDRWARVNNRWYFLDDKGIMYDNNTGTSYGKYSIVNVDGDEFCFSTSGAIQTGWIDLDDDRHSTRWHYFNSNGTHVTNDWKLISNKWYYFDANGDMVTGFLERTGTGVYNYRPITEPSVVSNGAVYFYLDPKNGPMLTGAVKIYDTDGKTVKYEYNFDKEGYMLYDELSYVIQNGRRHYYFYGSDGKKVTNLKNTTIWKDSAGKFYPADAAKAATDRAYATVDAFGNISIR